MSRLAKTLEGPRVARGRLAWQSRAAAVVLALIAAGLNGIWIWLDASSPSWDQSSYLSLALRYNDAVGSDGIRSLFSSMQQFDPARGPLYIVALMPILALSGDPARTALVLNLGLAPVLYFASGEIAYSIFRDWRSRLLAIVLVATTPIVVGLHHNVLVDFMLITLTCVSVMLLLKSDVFARRWVTVLMGVAMALGTLTKVTFPAFVFGPVLVAAGCLVCIGLRRSSTDATPAEPPAVGLTERLFNLGLAIGAYALLTLAWYFPNRDATLDYIRSTTSGPLSLGAGPQNPLTLHNMFAFSMGVANGHLSWLLVLAGMAAAGLNLATIAGWFRPPVSIVAIRNALSMGSWILIPYMLLLVGHNQDVRLMAPALAGVAICIAGGLAAIRWRVVRAGLSLALSAALIFQTLNRVVPLEPSWLPLQITVGVRSQSIVQPLAASYALGYERLPEKDRATPVISYLEQRSRTDGVVAPRSVCMLQSFPVVNSNTFSFLALARNDPFTFVDVVMGPDGEAGLATVLSTCDFALYIKPPPATAITAESRLTLVNDPYAANHMTPELFSLFRGGGRAFPIGEEPISDATSVPVDTAEVRVLVGR